MSFDLAAAIRSNPSLLAIPEYREALRGAAPAVRERRLVPVRLRADQSREGVVIGYGSVFGNLYRVGGPGWSVLESIERGAFAGSLRKRGGRVPVFWEHGWQEPIGYADADEDAHGLRVEAHLFIEDSERARTVWRSMDAGAIAEWSVGFIPLSIRHEERDGAHLEFIEEAELLEVSPVVKGANPATSTLEVRSK